MAGEEALETTLSRWRAWFTASWRRLTLTVIVVLAGLVLALAVLIDTSLGHRVVANYIAGLEPESGLRIKIGEINGSLYGKAQLNELTLSDPEGEFLSVPLTDLDWRPLNWFFYGLDIREISFKQGELSRFPALNPGDPDSPILPSFDLRIDSLEIDRLAIAEGLAGERREVSFVASARIEEGSVLLNANGDLGGTDRLYAMLEAEPDRDRFKLELDYNAPAGGLLAGLTGATQDWQASLAGEGGWTEWEGAFDVRREDREVAGFELSNRSGRFGARGDIRPEGGLEGLAGRLAGNTASLTVGGTFDDRTFHGEFALESSALSVEGKGGVNLSSNRFDQLAISARLLDSGLFGQDFIFEGASVSGVLHGNFGSPTIGHQVEIARFRTESGVFEGIRQEGTARREEGIWSIDLAMSVAKIVTGLDDVDRVLADVRIGGVLRAEDSLLRSERLLVNSPILSAQLALDANLARSTYAVSGTTNLTKFALPELGPVDAQATFEFLAGKGLPWRVEADVSGTAQRIESSFIAGVAGADITFGGNIAAVEDRPIQFSDSKLAGEYLELSFEGQLDGERLEVAGAGEHSDYGRLHFTASRQDEATQADITLDNPYDPAGLEEVHLALVSTEGGYRIETEGQSLLGPFTGRLQLLLPEDRPVRVAINRLDIWRTRVNGQFEIDDGLALGNFDLSGGGLDGDIALDRRAGGKQGFGLNIAARNASFGGRTELSIARADVALDGTFADRHSALEGTMGAQGISYGNFFLGRVAAKAELNNGRGNLAAAFKGQVGSDFDLQLQADLEPGQTLVAVKGQYRGRKIQMPRRARIELDEEGGWRLHRSQVSFGEGFLIAEARSGSDGGMEGNASLTNMPISVLGMVRPETGLRGLASGKIEWAAPDGRAPTAKANLRVADFNRVGLTLTSQPLDLQTNLSLSQRRLQVKAVANEDGAQLGRLSLSIDRLPADGGLVDRLFRGSLKGDLQFDGPASSIWRLVRVDTFDLTGPVALRAAVTGRLEDPRITGSLQGDGLRLRSAITGTDIRNLLVRGHFVGSRLQLTSFAGTTTQRGKVSGSGTIDLANLLERGPRIDIRVAASQARILDRSDMSATLTGPIRIVSDGVGGTIAGRVRIDRARWRLGRAEAEESFPQIETVEVNLPASRAPARIRLVPWSYLIDARANNRLEVDGMGLKSEWSADLRLRGTVDDPRIGGEAKLVRGDFSFAGTSFELEEGQIRFDETIAPDPVLNILASSQVDDLEVDVTVTGRATAPVIALRSVPPLPEDELLSRLLFGGKLNEVSPINALQLGSALASLKSGGGMGPINRLRQSVGIDRLRLLAPDPSIDRGTAVAAGRYFTRRLYAELISDGQGYTATQLEFRLTSWLTLMASVSSIGRERATVEYRKDY